MPLEVNGNINPRQITVYPPKFLLKILAGVKQNSAYQSDGIIKTPLITKWRFCFFIFKILINFYALIEQ